MVIQRFKNFIASFIILTSVYIFYTHQFYFKNYFSGTHNFNFSLYHFDITNFEAFRYIYITYICSLIFMNFFEKETRISKSVYFFRSLFKIIFHPIKTFENGLNPKEKVGFLAIIVKVFFTPLMIAWFLGNSESLIKNFGYVIQNIPLLTKDFLGVFHTHLFWVLFQLILVFDVGCFALGYLIEHPFLKNEIKSVEPTFFGWAVTLACYPPFNKIMNKVLPWQSNDFPYFDNPYLFIGLNLLLLILMGIYAWASVALFFKASNLTCRGVVSTGPYAYIRHPAYVCKNLAWWIGSIPAFIIASQKGFKEILIVFAIMTGWTVLYFLRAMTEERHFDMVDNDYKKYRLKVKYRFIPRIV